MTTKYSMLGEERKLLQSKGEIPMWVKTPAWQLLTSKGYVHEGETLRTRYNTMADTLCQYTSAPNYFRDVFLELLWEADLSPSTPVIMNTGRPELGMPVSCSGCYIPDNLVEFYDVAKRIAAMSKHSFGTSAYLGDIRPRGSKFGYNGVAAGVVPVADMLYNVAKDVSQNGRRGSVALYLPVSHGDFDEFVEYLQDKPEGKNCGFNFYDEDIKKLVAGDPEMIRRYQEVLALREIGQGYIFKPDTANRQAPQVFKDNGLKIHASNLCVEIAIPSNEHYDFSCVLSSINLEHWDKLKENKHLLFGVFTFVDAINSYFIDCSEGIDGLQKVRNFSIDLNALGVGTLGFGSYLQNKGIPFESLEAKLTNIEIFKTIREVGDLFNKETYKQLGGRGLMKGTGLRCSTLMAVAPNLSSASILSCSGSIEPVFSNVYKQELSGGEVRRASPKFLEAAKSKGIWNNKDLEDIIAKGGSVAHRDDFTQDEKDIFKTSYEINMNDVLIMASARQKYIDQGQSLNLFMNPNVSEDEYSKWHSKILLDDRILGAYYVRSTSINLDSTSGCTNCE